MDIVSIKCPNCGAPVERKGSEYFAKCPYCNLEVSFDEIKEEAQIDELKDRIGSYEKMQSFDANKRADLHKWTVIRNVAFAVVGVLNFCGFVLVGASEINGNSIGPMVGFGSMFVLFAFVIGFATPFALAYYYPTYNVLTGEIDPHD